MSERDRRFFSGNSLDQAVMLAARHYHLDPEELRYSVLDKRHGFLRIRRSVVIEVDPANPRQATPTAPESEPPPAAPPAPAERRSRERREAKAEQRDRPQGEKGEEEGGKETQVERRVERPPQKETTGDKPWWQQGPAEEDERPEEEPYDEGPYDEEPYDEGSDDEGEGAWEDEEDEFAEEEPAEEELRPLREQLPEASGAMAMAAERAMRLALRFARAEMEMAVLQGDERLEIELWGRDEERVLADDGDLLLALQQLMARLIRGFVGETVPVRVDCANFHERRKREVGRLARRIAQRVAERGRGETMEPMAPDERRLVHIALRDDRRVETRSVGRGYYKRVAIEPS